MRRPPRGEEQAIRRLPEVRGPSLPRQFAAQLVHFFALLWVAAALALRRPDAAARLAIIAVVIVNGAVNFVQE